MRTKTKILVVTLLAGVGLLVSAPSALSFISGLTVNGTAPLSVNGTSATVSGTIQCSPGVAFIDVQLVQGKGSTVTIGDADEQQIVCDGSVKSWSAIVSVPQGTAFKPGQATVRVFADDADNFREIQTTIRLTNR
jgi:hypothetical protein